MPRPPKTRVDDLPILDERRPIVRLLFGINRVYGRALHDLRVLSPCRVQPSGPAILICNHSAGLDPVLLQAVCPRVITWMMASEYYDLPVLGTLARRMGYISVARSGRDSAALRLALRSLEAGRLLGVFPEGRIEPGQDLLPFQPGVAMMALRAGVPIYPAYIGGLQRNISTGRSLLDRQRARVAFGEKIFPHGSVHELTQKLTAAVATLKNQCLAGGQHRNVSSS